MTSLNQDNNQASYQIRSYTPGTLKINDKTYHHSVIVTLHNLIEPWLPESADQITIQTLQPIIDLQPDVLLIGTGAEHIFLNLDIYGELINRGIGVEIMSTSAACRTFSALSAENRNVAAALIIR